MGDISPEELTLLILLGLIIGLFPTIIWLILRYKFKVDIKQPGINTKMAPILLASIFAFKDAGSATKQSDE